MQVHILRDNVPIGLFSVEEVEDHFAQGFLWPTDLAWHEGILTALPLGQLIVEGRLKTAPQARPSQPRRPPGWKQELLALLSGPGVSEVKDPRNWNPILKLAVVIYLGSFAVSVVGVVAAATSNIPLCLFLSLFLFLAGIRWYFPLLHQTMREVWQLYLGKSPSQLLRNAAKPPALYLRSFHFDDAAADAPPWKDSLPLFLPITTAELRVMSVVSWRMPVLAIGKPGETLPPVGAARFYVDHDVWKQKVQAILPLCQIVIWATGHTEGLDWELRHLIKNYPPERLLLWLHMHVARSNRQDRQQEWKRFLRVYGGLFPKPLPVDIAKIRFIGFRHDWTPQPIPGDEFRTRFWERLITLPGAYGLGRYLDRRKL